MKNQKAIQKNNIAVPVFSFGLISLNLPKPNKKIDKDETQEDIYLKDIESTVILSNN